MISYGNFSTTYGEPQLRVYVGGVSPGFVSSASASGVVSGSSATFPFPTQSNGSPLAQGFYALVNEDSGAGGIPVWVNSSYLAVGGSTTLSSAFGVDAGDVTGLTCVVVSGKPSCRTLVPTTAPAFTQYYSGDITYKGKTITVGSEPVAVRLYGSYTSETTVGSTTTTTTGPAYAIVANSGSSSVSIVSFSTNTDVANIAVGAQPMALTLNSAPATATYAYVASYGNSSLAEVDLATKAITRTVTGLSGALSVAMDPSGSYVWVGGNNYLYKVSLSTFTVAGNVPVSGSVTSLATSSAQNELVYTVVQNCCTSSSTYAANELALANLSNPGTYAHAAATPYAPYTMNGTLPSAAVLPQASAVVSANFSNGMGASATPTGFVIYDLITHQQIMTGNTPTPVRGIASDPDCMFAYFTLPDSNEYIAVPLESAP
jgi:YVTN family beta-propeller protein